MRVGKWMAAPAAVGLALAFAACGSSDDSSSSSGSTSGGGDSGGKAKTVGLAMDVLRNDHSFGSATYGGAQRAAKDLGVKLNVIDNLGADPKKAQSAVLNLAKDNDVTLNGVNAMMASMPRLAQQYPKKQFGTYAVAVPEAANLHWAYQDWYPLAYAAGVVAAKTTKTGVIGFVGGGEIPPTIAGEAAYKAAAKATNPDVKVVSTITGDFNDPAKGKDAAQAQIAQKADVILSFVDAGHEGVVAAAKAAGNVKLIGVVIPKCDISQGLEIGDIVSRQDQLVYNLITGMVKGNPQNQEYGLQDPKVADLAFCPGQDSPELKGAVDKVRADFTSGALSTPEKLKAVQSAPAP